MYEDEEFYLTLDEATIEVNNLLKRIRAAEEFIARAEEFYKDRSDDWHSSIGARFEIILERKREQVQEEKHLVERMGMNIAMGRYPQELEE
jgi:hypothetical protein